MTGFHDRYRTAEAWELDLIQRLQDVGWLVDRFGQAQIPEDMRRYLIAWRDTFGRPTLVRWMPDIIAIHPANMMFCLIDAKTDRSKTPNYAVEVDAIEAGKGIVRDWNTPVYYVWPDGGVMTPGIVDNRWNRKMDGKGTNGSNTAFYLVDKSFRLSAYDVFGLASERAS